MTMSKEITFICINCSKEHTSPNKYSCKTQFCSNECQGEYQIKEGIKTWLAGLSNPDIRTIGIYLRILRGNECENCHTTKWMSKPIPLEVEHKDGNSENSSPDNVMLLCPNCHAQTDTYKGKNRGSGRHSRRERYSKGLSY
jgi:5-methylcytosine-specific restriction endonuclease McrA